MGAGLGFVRGGGTWAAVCLHEGNDGGVSAVALKKRGKCTICLPDWTTADRLTQVMDAARESPR